jgi:hypothetical protein
MVSGPEMFDSPLRWHVPSKSVEGETHLVDLGVKQCSCRYWVTTVGPALRKGEKPRQYCSHYKAAKDAFSDWALEKFIQHEKKQNEEHGLRP